MSRDRVRRRCRWPSALRFVPAAWARWPLRPQDVLGFPGHQLPLSRAPMSSRTWAVGTAPHGGKAAQSREPRSWACEPLLPISRITRGSHVTRASVSLFKEENQSSRSYLLGASVCMEQGEVQCHVPSVGIGQLSLQHRLRLGPLAKKRWTLFYLC